MSYYESAEGERITRGRVSKELKSHGLSCEEGTFDREMVAGPDGLYSAQAVLRWLGY